MTVATKTLSILLACGVAANAYLAWELHSRLPPSTAELDRDLAALAETAPVQNSEDPQVKAEQALSAAIRAQTRDMLEQRRAAALRFVDLRYTVTGAAAPTANADQLAALEADITQQRATLAERKAAVDEVRAGTIHTQQLASLSLVETTLALLERRHLALKYGVALPTAPTPSAAVPAADKDAIAALEADIAERRRVIADTRKDADQYSGGLIKVTLLQRLATEQATLAALEQRLLSLKHGLPPAPGLPPVAAVAVAAEVLAPLDADIAATRASIAAGEREASRYTGGLIYVTILSRVATERMTLAMLEQRRLSIKHGLTAAPPSLAGDAAPKPKGPPGAVVTDKEAL
ncbi:hypothetical protein JJL56_02180 [Azospirillum sp. YIM DDC1]|uniref:Uncharacterized protein n=1 Tax=Azospirillum aestuarii TaxID=2802052 RepID=A0ABS1HTP4_9PROT|nr:hypothetical protein [Azospirillum aestuarii]MBK4717668.1 hypothetical protein [Azospirillum aestuarii]